MADIFPAPGNRCGVRNRGNGEVTEVVFGKKAVVISVKLDSDKKVHKLKVTDLIGWAGSPQLRKEDL